MYSNSKLSYAIAAILSGSSIGLSHAATASDPSDSLGLQEIIVTAQRRDESMQNVPITMQALSGDQLQQLSVSTFDDVIKYLPNVTFPTNGPGQGNIYMRGLSTGFAGNQGSATKAQFPNVAVYLDDQSMQFPSRNLDIYMVDMARIEVLEGPQGTLFGGGAEAGAVRYITNKPKLNETEGNIEASYGTTAGGDPNTSVNATLNLPLIPDTLALRGVIYDDRRGGYINNVQSTFTRRSTDLGVAGYEAYATGCSAGAPVEGVCQTGTKATAFGNPPGSPVANNYNIAGTDSNPVTYQGIRVSALYKINDDWDVLIAQSYQNMEADGYFVQFPIGSDGQILGPDQITAFTPNYDKDKYENTSWTVNGKIGDLKAIYTGGYTVRNIEQQNDYTNYTRSSGGFYYSCTGGPANDGLLGAGKVPAVCYSPVEWWDDTVRNTHQSHEFRLSTPDDWRVRGLVGAYWEDFEIQDVVAFNGKPFPSCTPANLASALAGGATCVADVTTAPGSTATAPGMLSDSTSSGYEAQRGYKQTALFGSVDYDLIPKVLTVTGGTRYYHYSEFETGSQYYTNTSAVNVPNGQCGPACYTNINAENLNATASGFKSRGNLTWHITPDTMLYYTFSQGFRPGAFNRTVSGVAKDADGNPQYEKPKGYTPDSLTNNEIGLKSEFLDHRLQFNASVYHMNWDNVQVLFYNPTALGNVSFVTNGPNYSIDGLELQLVARVTDGLTLQGSGSYNHSKQTNSPCLIGNIVGNPTFGTCITEVKGAPFPNPFGSEGGVPADSPALQYNLRARYDWSFNDYKAFVMVGGNYVGSSYNQPDTATSGENVTIPTSTLLRYEMPSYTTFDASLGVAKDNWTAQLFGTNLSNSNASTLTSSAQFIEQETPLRPRVLGLKFGYKF